MAATFAALPGAVPLDGVPDAWFCTHAPEFGHTAILSRAGKHAFQCYAHNSYDEGVARAVVTFAREHDDELIAAPEHPLVVVEGFEHPGFGFDTVVAVRATVHKYQSDKPEVTRAVFPAYGCEFSGAETQDEAAYRYTRAAGAQPSRWDREPNSYLKIRHRAASGREIPSGARLGARADGLRRPGRVGEAGALRPRPGGGRVRDDQALTCGWLRQRFSRGCPCRRCCSARGLRFAGRWCTTSGVVPRSRG